MVSYADLDCGVPVVSYADLGCGIVKPNVLSKIMHNFICFVGSCHSLVGFRRGSLTCLGKNWIY
jgi:hypothetical protein